MKKPGFVASDDDDKRKRREEKRKEERREVKKRGGREEEIDWIHSNSFFALFNLLSIASGVSVPLRIKFSKEQIHILKYKKKKQTREKKKNKEEGDE